LATTNSNFKVKNGLDAGGTITGTGLTVTGTSSVITLNGQVGSDGQVLTSKGPGVTPIWNTVSGSLGYIGNFQTTASAGSTISLTVPDKSSGAPNTISLQAGGHSGSGVGANGGAISITGGSQLNVSAVKNGGAVNISGGNSSTAGIGGDVFISGGTGGANGGGNATIQAGPSSGGNGTVFIGTSNTDLINIGASLKPVSIVGNVSINPPYTGRPSGSVSITGANPNGTDGGHIYIQSALAGTGAPGNIYLDAQLDEVGAIGGIYIGTGIDGAASASSQIKIGTAGTSLYIDSSIINGFKIANSSSTVPPIRFTNGSNSGATVTNNTIDYINGSLLTLSPEFATAGYGRAAIYAPVWAYSNANSTASTSTTAQALFPTGSRTMTLVAGNNYYFKLLLSFTSTFTSGTSTIQLVPVFSNTPQSINYTSLWLPGTAGNALAVKGTSTTATSISPSITATQTNAGVIIEGNFRANATTGGTLRFDFRMSATGSSTVALSGSYQQIMNLGNLGANTPAVVSGGWT
jgi:hypothetical protein